MYLGQHHGYTAIPGQGGLAHGGGERWSSPVWQRRRPWAKWGLVREDVLLGDSAPRQRRRWRLRREVWLLLLMGSRQRRRGVDNVVGSIY